jgi:hypothetical protein
MHRMLAMTIEQFRASLQEPTPPAALSPLLSALWWDGKGNWDQAHEIAQSDEESQDAAWVHAYLHRKQGDTSNARYWYRRAAQPVSEATFDAEWRQIVRSLLGR